MPTKLATRHHCRAMETLLYLGLSCSIVRLGVVAIREGQSDTNDRPGYQFRYKIHDLITKDYKTHEEVGENGFVRGTYSVRESNGDLRVVTYTAGDSRGFQAMVRIKPTFALPSEEKTLEAKQTTESSTLKVSTSTMDTEDKPLKIQLGTERRSYNFEQVKHVAEKIQQLSQRSKNTTPNMTTPKPEAGKQNINHDLESQETIKQQQSIYPHKHQNSHTQKHSNQTLDKKKEHYKIRLQ